MYLVMRRVQLATTESLFLLVVEEEEEYEIMTFVPGYEAGQTANYRVSLLLGGTGERRDGDHDLFKWLKEGEEIKISVVLYLAMRLVKLPATEPLFILVVEEKDETCDPSDRWELLTDTRTF